ncbi:MAG: flagellar filament capping protein FliD [Polyangiaceae bacterium]|nr:flagellar filament capping protein FliD [Polyangiaceae bacterium]
MAGTVTFAGIGSGMDVESLITGLVQASRTGVSALQSRRAASQSAVTTMSDVSSLLSTLETAAKALDTVSEARTLKASTTGTGVVASASGAALPGSYTLEVSSLAHEQRSYSSSFASSTDALGQTGTLDVTVGTGDPLSVTVEAGDSLEGIAAKINALGGRVSASVLNEGSGYRLQVRGLDTGADNALTFAESGVALGLDQPGSVRQAATDAVMTVDGFTITRSTNQVSGAIPGVTLALTAETTDPVTLTVETDASALRTKLQSLADAYNAVVRKSHQVAGHGTQKASNPVLSGDSALRTVTSSLSRTVLETHGDAGTYQTLGAIGMKLERDGTLSVDAAKLDAALAADPGSVEKLLGGSDSFSGAADALRDVALALTEPDTGAVALRKATFEARGKALADRIANEEKRLVTYEELLRKQFNAMDQSVAASNSTLQYLLTQRS